MELLFVLFLESGIIKAFLIYFGVSLPMDITLLLSLMIVFGILFIIIKTRTYTINAKSLFLICLLAFFYLWINITIFYSPSSTYSYKKSFFFLTNILAFVAPLFYVKFDTIKFAKYFAILSPL